MSRVAFTGRIGLVLIVVAGVLSASASAANVQFEVSGGTFPQEYKGTSALGSLLTVGGSSIVCKKDKFTGKITGSGTVSTTGTAAIDFEECESLGFKCKSPTDAAGTILVNVNVAPVWITSKGTLAGVLFTPEKAGGNFAEIECTSLVKITVKGELLCNYSPANSFVTAATIKCKEGEKGKSEYTKYSVVLPVVEKTANPLLSSVNGGGFEESALVNEEALTSTNKISLTT